MRMYRSTSRGCVFEEVPQSDILQRRSWEQLEVASISISWCMAERTLTVNVYGKSGDWAKLMCAWFPATWAEAPLDISPSMQQRLEDYALRLVMAKLPWLRASDTSWWLRPSQTSLVPGYPVWLLMAYLPAPGRSSRNGCAVH